MRCCSPRLSTCAHSSSASRPPARRASPARGAPPPQSGPRRAGGPPPLLRSARSKCQPGRHGCAAGLQARAAQAAHFMVSFMHVLPGSRTSSRRASSSSSLQPRSSALPSAAASAPQQPGSSQGGSCCAAMQRQLAAAAESCTNPGRGHPLLLERRSPPCRLRVPSVPSSAGPQRMPRSPPTRSTTPGVRAGRGAGTVGAERPAASGRDSAPLLPLQTAAGGGQGAAQRPVSCKRLRTGVRPKERPQGATRPAAPRAIAAQEQIQEQAALRPGASAAGRAGRPAGKSSCWRSVPSGMKGFCGRKNMPRAGGAATHPPPRVHRPAAAHRRRRGQRRPRTSACARLARARSLPARGQRM